MWNRVAEEEARVMSRSETPRSVAGFEDRGGGSQATAQGWPQAAFQKPPGAVNACAAYLALYTGAFYPTLSETLRGFVLLC